MYRRNTWFSANSVALWHNVDKMSTKFSRCRFSLASSRNDRRCGCHMTDTKENKWKIWIDRGGTFTDIVAQNPDGSVLTHKLLSENPEQYRDAAVQGIRDLMGISRQDDIPITAIKHIKIRVLTIVISPIDSLKIFRDINSNIVNLLTSWLV